MMKSHTRARLGFKSIQANRLRFMALWVLFISSIIITVPLSIHGEQRDWLDIPYANLSGNQKLDISLPTSGNGPFPVIVSIHGGGFVTGDKRMVVAVPVRGYAVVAVNYRLCGEAKFPSQIHDIKAAIRWIRANAKTYHLNPDKIAVWGESAGGYLAALAGTSGDVKELEDLGLGNPEESCRVQAVVDWFGPIDSIMSDLYFLESIFLGKKIKDNPGIIKTTDPQTFISPDDPPFFIQHGTADKSVPVEQSINFATQLKKVLGKDKVTLDLLKGARHADAMFSSWDNLNKVLDFLDKYMK
jgi:acetyl esterase/lipase